MSNDREHVGFVGAARLIELDDSTPYLREMRRRAETPEDSEIVMEFDADIDEAIANMEVNGINSID